MTEPKQKNSLWGAIKGAIIEETPEVQPTQQPSTPPPQSPSPAPQRTAPASVRPEADQAARKRLEDSITASAPPGYAELMGTVETLADSIPEEGARFRAALKLAAKRGNSLDDILGDVDKCIGLLEEKGRQFEAETKAQMEKKVGAKQKAVAQLDETIKAKQAQIEALQREVSELSERRGTEAATISTEAAHITAVQEGFGLAYQAVYAQLQERRRKVAEYGKAVV